MQGDEILHPDDVVTVEPGDWVPPGVAVEDAPVEPEQVPEAAVPVPVEATPAEPEPFTSWVTSNDLVGFPREGILTKINGDWIEAVIVFSITVQNGTPFAAIQTRAGKIKAVSAAQIVLVRA